jgi:NADH-quinone oxidoreductase subunit L
MSRWLYLAVPFVPLFSAMLVGIFGTHLGGKIIGKKLSAWICVIGVFLSCVASFVILQDVVTSRRVFNENLYTWAQVGNISLQVGFLVDSLTALMMCVVTFVSLMVHIYTVGYMAEDEGYARFFSYISLFTFSMLMLVMSNNLLQLFFGWEAVGLVSYLLIGFWFKKDSAVFANMKAFLVNRVGDFGFLIGIALLVNHFGSFDYATILKAENLRSLLVHPDLVTAIGVCLFIGAMGKSAQFPLHVWLPDSMEGPTPISALIHAATMVTAGIFMVARLSPIFEMSDVVLSFILVIGSITALFMGFLGVIQNDIKRVVAYSTLSQLGYMVVGLGVSAYSVSVFHLMTHAFFKALLFLAAGSVIMGMHHQQDMRYMGGLRKYMPVTWLVSLLGSLALVGMPFFSGFYSKDMLIEAVKFSTLPGASFAYFAVMAGVFVTAFYAFRMYFLVFHGKPRFDQIPHDPHHPFSEPHESPRVVTIPLILLAIPSVFIGGWLIDSLLFGSFFDGVIHVNHQLHPVMTELKQAFHGALAMGLHAFQTPVFYLVLAGIVSSWLLYCKYVHIPSLIQKRFVWIYRLLENKYFLDQFNQTVFAGGARAVGQLFWKVTDVYVIDGIVNAVAYLWRGVGRGVRLIQTGFLYHYAFVMVLSVLSAVAYFLFRV